MRSLFRGISLSLLSENNWKDLMTSIQRLPPAPSRVGNMSWWKLFKTSLCHLFANHITTTFRRQACVHLVPIIFNPALGFCLSRQEIFVTLGIFFSKKKSSFHCHYYQSNPAPPNQLHISLVIFVTVFISVLILINVAAVSLNRRRRRYIVLGMLARGQ